MADGVIGEYPNKTTRKLLAVEWKTLDDEKKLVLRAARSKRGIRCDICGTVGYFRENCPNGCTSPPKTPDSLASTPPVSARKEEPPSPAVGVFWGTESGAVKAGVQKSFYQAKQKVDVNIVRPQAMETLSTLRSNDQSLGSFAFFTRADNAYATDYAELTLHQVMRRMMRLLEKQLRENVQNLTASFDTTLLHPPADKVGDTFYPPEMAKNQEYQDYFIKKTLKNDRKLKYKNQASLRPIDDLDSIFRGGNLRDDHLYTVKPNAGESMHAKNTWKSVLARNDTLANSDPALVRKQEELDKLFKDQSQWISSQQKSMGFRNDRFEHVVHILQTELKKEHARDAKILQGVGKRGRKEAMMEVWTERLASVDQLTLLLKNYRFTAGLEEADFLIYCLNKWKEVSAKALQANAGSEGAVSKGKDVGKAKSSGKDLVAASTNPYFPDTVFLEQYNKKCSRLHEKSKGGSVFTAAEQRTFNATMQEEQRSQLKRMDSTLSHRTNSREASRDHTNAPDMAELMAAAESESAEFAQQDAKRAAMIERYNRTRRGSSQSANGNGRKYKMNPREADEKRISKMKKSFRLAGLGQRIRKGNDTDPAHALPALIPIPRAFDGDTRIESYAAQNIVYQLKKDMVLSDIGKPPSLCAISSFECLILSCRIHTSTHGAIVCAQYFGGEGGNFPAG